MFRINGSKVPGSPVSLEYQGKASILAADGKTVISIELNRIEVRELMEKCEKFLKEGAGPAQQTWKYTPSKGVTFVPGKSTASGQTILKPQQPPILKPEVDGDPFGSEDSDIMDKVHGSLAEELGAMRGRFKYSVSHDP